MILDGALASGASTAWVAINSSSFYTIQVKGTNAGGIGVEVSVDGTNPAPLTSGPSVIGGSGDDRTLGISGRPFAFMRATNSTPSPITAKVYVAML